MSVILESPVGTGKTFMAIYLILKLKLKCIIAMKQCNLID